VSTGGGGARNPRSLANLRRGGPPNAGSVRPGEARALVHGARSRQPQRSPEWSPAVRESIADLEQRAGLELRDDSGEVAAWARPSLEVVAIQRVATWRMDRYIADRQARGRLSGQDLKLQTEVTDAYHRALEREALTLTGRIEATGQLARLMSQADLSKLSDDELDDLLRKFEAEKRQTFPAPPDAAERSRRAAQLLAEGGGLPDLTSSGRSG
jgi:hypothetical protein